jgi:hypothetical protein
MTSFAALARLTSSDWARLGEASALVVTVRTGLRLLPFDVLCRLLDRRARMRPAVPDSRPHVAWAVGAVSRRLRGTRCLAEALTAHTMLRRHGHDATLRIGARSAAPAAIEAHAWVECDGEVVAGRVPGIEDYALLT